MKSILVTKRAKAIFSISFIAISIGVISNKVISYQTGRYIKGSKELTLNKGINKFFI